MMNSMIPVAKVRNLRMLIALSGAIILLYLAGIIILVPACQNPRSVVDVNMAEIDHDRIIRAADRYLDETPQTVTAFRAERSAGGKHDFYSEGDYWWPDPGNPDGPYIRRDGMTNPDNFRCPSKSDDTAQPDRTGTYGSLDGNQGREVCYKSI